ncbi:MAG: hypothetical protein K0R78_2672 [Pelosinus sp.]|jgi:hypothetical protein|nr:hypothetical protein [Pelosinus sp.]
MTGSGYPFKVNDIIFPVALLAPEGYANTPNRRQDKGSYTDGRGKTIRNILPVKRSTIKIKTRDYLTYGQKLIIQAFFPNKDMVSLTYWNDEDNAYKTIQCYVPDVEYVVKHIDKAGNFYYNAIDFEYIDYGEG